MTTASRMVSRLTATPLGIPLSPANLGSMGELQTETGSSMQTEAGVLIELEGTAQHAVVTAARQHTILTAVASS